MNKISSTTNPLVKEIRLRHLAKGRRQFGDFLIEGPHLLEEALRAGIPLKLVFLTEDYSCDQFTQEDIDRVCPDVYHVNEKVMKVLSTVPSHQGCVAVVDHSVIKRHHASIQKKTDRVLWLDGVQDPGNVGTLIRTAEAAGWNLVVLGTGCADLFSPRVVRSTQGAFFHIPVLTVDSTDWLSEFKKNGGAVMGTESSTLLEPVDYEQAETSLPLCLVLGSEGSGMSKTVASLCDQMVTIPINGKSESLSVSVAGGILLYQFRGRP